MVIVTLGIVNKGFYYNKLPMRELLTTNRYQTRLKIVLYFQGLPESTFGLGTCREGPFSLERDLRSFVNVIIK